MRLFFQANIIGVILKIIIIILALPSFIMGVNGRPKFEAHKSASIHHKVLHTALGLNKGLLKQSCVCVRNISIFKPL